MRDRRAPGHGTCGGIGHLPEGEGVVVDEQVGARALELRQRRARVGKRESSEQVVIAESGALPARIDVGAAVPAAKRAPAAAPSAPPAPLAPAAAPTPAKAPKPTGLTVDKQFQ